MLADELRSHSSRDCSTGGRMLVSGLFDSLLRGLVLLPGISASRPNGFKSISTRDVVVNSCRNRRTRTWSVLGRRSLVRTTIDQDSAGEELRIRAAGSKSCPPLADCESKSA